ncbi:MAG: carbon-nitrogen hydrolase family protein [Lentisphaeria bacterium]|nr:carbon-nitrogen hydrolase family protein [Lentisphaeria bacterium]
MSRIGTIQLQALNDSPSYANPFADGFSLDALDAAIESRLDLIETWLDHAGENIIDLVVTTEDLTGLGMAMTYLDDPDIFRSVVKSSSQAAESRLAEAARRNKIHIVACYYEADGDLIYNVAVLFDRQGAVIGKYRKVHLPVYESWLVTAGDSFPVFETDIGRIGMTICYDQMWPEATAACALNGAEIVCLPSAASPEIFRLQTRALDNQVFIVSSHSDHSLIAAPNGEVLANAEDTPEGIVWADIKITEATTSGEHFFDYLYSGIRDHKERHLKHRRPVAYAPLTNSSPPLANYYPASAVESAEAKQLVYAEHKAEMLRQLKNEQHHWHWRWQGDPS